MSDSFLSAPVPTFIAEEISANRGYNDQHILNLGPTAQVYLNPDVAQRIIEVLTASLAAVAQ